jgi:hypothetical protein
MRLAEIMELQVQILAIERDYGVGERVALTEVDLEVAERGLELRDHLLGQLADRLVDRLVSLRRKLLDPRGAPRGSSRTSCP